MKTLKRLLESGDDAAILEYVKSNDFTDIVSEYEALSSSTRALKKDYVKLFQESVARIEELSAMREQMGVMSDKILKETVNAGSPQLLAPQSASWFK